MWLKSHLLRAGLVSGAPRIAAGCGSRQKLATEFGATEIVAERGRDGAARVMDLSARAARAQRTRRTRGQLSAKWPNGPDPYTVLAEQVYLAARSDR
jgi:hypothetical protein